MCLTDVLRTVADILDVDLDGSCAEDSYSFLSALKPADRNESDRKPQLRRRRDVIHHSISGYFAIRQDAWKLCLCPRSGGWTASRPSVKSWAKAEAEGLPMIQLYNMNDDIGEQENLAEKNPEKVEELRVLLLEQVGRGRSTEGDNQANDVPVNVAKRPR